MSEDLFCDSCWEPVDEVDLWDVDADTNSNGYIVCSKCEDGNEKS